MFARPVTTTRTTESDRSSYATTPRVFTFKKVNHVLADHLPGSGSSIVFHYGSVQVLHPAESFFTAEPNFLFTITNHFPGTTISKKEVERVLKDHLLHLFPSHYFW
jgi:hypothetical protein